MCIFALSYRSFLPRKPHFVIGHFVNMQWKIFLLYGDKITIILCFLALKRACLFAHYQFIFHRVLKILITLFSLFTSFLGEHVFHHITGEQQVILCCEDSVNVVSGCFQVCFCELGMS